MLWFKTTVHYYQKKKPIGHKHFKNSHPQRHLNTPPPLPINDPLFWGGGGQLFFLEGFNFDLEKNIFFLEDTIGQAGFEGRPVDRLDLSDRWNYLPGKVDTDAARPPNSGDWWLVIGDWERMPPNLNFLANFFFSKNFTTIENFFLYSTLKKEKIPQK